MYCIKCGNNLNEKNLYCSSCGTQTTKLSATEEGPKKKCNKCNGTGKTFSVLMISGSLTIVGIVGYLLYLDLEIFKGGTGWFGFILLSSGILHSGFKKRICWFCKGTGHVNNTIIEN